MAGIEIGLALTEDLPLLEKIDLGFESNFVWKNQTSEDLNRYSISFEKEKLPKNIRVDFQAYLHEGMEGMIRRHEILAVRYNDKIIGYFRIEFEKNINGIILQSGGLTPEYRCKGIGTAVLRQIETIALNNHVHAIVCILQAKNDPSIRFLLRHGFSFCGYREFYFPNMEIGMFFSKNIRQGFQA